MKCHECGEKLTDYEESLSTRNDLTRGWCIDCISQFDIDDEELLVASRGQY